MMDKTELLFRMMEQPEKYDDEQWRNILDDEDCRELYTTMLATRSALEAQRYDQQADDAAVQQEWERFVAKHPQAGSSSRPIWRRAAAVAAVIVITACIVVAAVHTRGFGLLQEHHPSGQATQHATVVTTTNVTSDVIENQDEIPSLTDNEAHLYDNVPLEQIIGDMAAKYDVQVEWQSHEARSLRLYYRWEPSYSLDKVVDMLNSFQSFTIQHTGNKLIISDITANQ